ncbi:TetR/AcrR family transcriptional regulator [Companilactobacillus sp. HBUAS56275]|uniref:TetR/AcrR family transcriptional regulator n=1 Tax=Candidatus Companilactobacillus pullicola TaxID=2838523 RepID=A0A9D1ZL39_9LACO|nr:TetR/AcrR family transcriptional regulator [Candidatus Companilactobacillus pullicola]
MAATEHSQKIKQDSQQYLITALLQLLKTKDFNDITVTQVVKRAGVSRMAFYRNFESLDDVLIAYIEPKINASFENIINRIPQDQKLNALGSFFEEIADTLKMAVNRHYESIIQDIFNKNMTKFYDQTMNWSQFSPMQRKYWVKFMSAGVYAIWREWLISGQNETINDIHVLLADFQISTLKALENETTK